MKLWHKTSEELPEKNCGVVIANFDEDDGRLYSIYHTNFNYKIRRFNVYNNISTAIDADAWAYLEDIEQVIKGELKWECL